MREVGKRAREIEAGEKARQPPRPLDKTTAEVREFRGAGGMKLTRQERKAAFDGEALR